MVHIRPMTPSDWPDVRKIYLEGIATKTATFQTEAPVYDAWDSGHLSTGRLVAESEDGTLLGWIALSPTSSRPVYRGVVEVSVYVAAAARGKGVGAALLNAAIAAAETDGLWLLQSAIFEINTASRKLHEKCGFRTVGYRERIAKDADGVWRNTVLMERRGTLD